MRGRKIDIDGIPACMNKSKSETMHLIKGIAYKFYSRLYRLRLLKFYYFG